METNKIARTYYMTISQADKIYYELGRTPINGPDDYRIAFYDYLGETIRDCYDYEGAIDFTFTGTKREHKFFNKMYKMHVLK